jgi:hypothetical protein
MNNKNWKDSVELIGILSIVGSLIFVAIQLRQTHEIVVAQQYQERAAIVVDVMTARLQSPATVERLGQSISTEYKLYESVELSPTELGQIYIGERLSLASIDNNHYQWESGYLSDDAWSPYRSTLINILKNPMCRFIVEKRGGLYRESFRKLTSALIEENKAALGK